MSSNIRYTFLLNELISFDHLQISAENTVFGDFGLILMITQLLSCDLVSMPRVLTDLP
jgi:hypothetical protein